VQLLHSGEIRLSKKALSDRTARSIKLGRRQRRTLLQVQFAELGFDHRY
jgi:hypothetical protein